ncbi:MAG: HEPN domain-containing protein, partial [Syntrophaceae bacterium]|nr:HEPN domain-containing protein [Syntrophaceae bacterium]
MNKDLTPMNADEFHEKMRLIDAELSQKGVPVYERPFQAFPIAAPDYNGPLMSFGIDSSEYGEYEGPNLLAKIHNWYKQMYGKRASAARDLGRIPIIIKEQIYLVRIPLVYETAAINILPFIEGLTPAVARRLSDTELDEIHNKFIEGYSLAHEFEDLYFQLEAEERNGTKRKNNPFLDSAIQDKDAAADCLDEEIDTNGAVFHSRQIAEKMLKAVLFYLANMNEEEITQKYGHRIADIYKDVSSYVESPARINSEINYITRYKMDIRDTETQVPDSEAVKAFWSGLRIGGFCAALLSGPERKIQSIPIKSTKEGNRMKSRGSDAKAVKQMTIEEMLAPFEALRVAVLATVEEGKPYTSIIAFALTPDRR